ncbi:metal ABC transporter solute-binding protein, Zn/Mn family [Actinophytocola sp.]|uniref:metal ABC transporter solute-binding protein, Zn/Mn family n=1 Tax=Actinophytocola sp. TaxID=1872138 RepID=UPI002ED77308
MRLSRSIPVLASVGALTLALAGCGNDASGGTGGAAAGGKITVIASTNVWGSVAQAVGGDAVSVRSLINDASSDPHAHPDNPEEATALAGADLAVYNGGGYDDFFTKLVQATGTKARQVDAFKVSGYAEGENEHVWYDPPTVKKVADKIADELGAIDAAKKATFADNAAALSAKVDTIAGQAAQIGKDHPGAKVVATEPVAHYLLNAAGLTDVTPPKFSEAIEQETDPSVAVVAETTQLISGKQVAVLVNNAQTETPITNSLSDAAAKAGIPVVQVTETLPQGVTGYVEWMTKQLDTLAGALSKS